MVIQDDALREIEVGSAVLLVCEVSYEGPCESWTRLLGRVRAKTRRLH